MEPMTLGSPSGSSLSGAAGAGPGYLPSFLMGDPPSTPRPNTLSPTRGRSSLAYSHGLMSSPPDGLRSPTLQQQHHHHQQQQQQQHLLGLHQQQHQQQLSSSFMQPHTPQGHHVPHSQRYLQNPQPAQAAAAAAANQFRNESFDANSSITGPPTQGLFDSWRKEKQLLQTPMRAQQQQSGPGNNPADPTTATIGPSGAPFNESYAQNQSGFNLSRVMSPIPVDYNQRNVSITTSPTGGAAPFGGQQQQQTQVQQAAKSSNWVTVFGFPQNAASKILSHFIGIGTIVDKQPAPQNGNWVHLRYSSRLECDRALNYNGRIISEGLMIGVQYCNDPAILGKENEGNEYSDAQGVSSPDKPLWRVRSLMNMSYSAMQDPQAVISAPPVQKRANGIVNKAMDLFFGW
ncbi:nucleoporin Nup35 [Anopheles arabiensis]|uniref:Nucleoporin NUP35 n=1 Tax=Anopheles arabiensis TaxID=7173 RepID=A0A182IBL2_ANOAR|nr:nucleoporin Nup35 [Anopheles arabiensis]